MNSTIWDFRNGFISKAGINNGVVLKWGCTVYWNHNKEQATFKPTELLSLIKLKPFHKKFLRHYRRIAK